MSWLEVRDDDGSSAEVDNRVVLAHGSRRPGTGAPIVVVPRPLTPLVGREADVARVRAVVERAERRLVTLTGPGGVGKAWLALEAAASRDVMVFPDGVAFVPLAGMMPMRGMA